MEYRGRGMPLQERERASRHYGVSPSDVTPEMILSLPERGTGLEQGAARGLSQERVEEIARAAAREVVAESVSQAEAPVHIAEHEATGHALVVDAVKAEATPCKTFTFEGVKYGWSPGCVGLISEKRNPEQFTRFCKVCLPVSKGLEERFSKVKKAVAKAHDEWEAEGGDLAAWWEKVGPALER